MIILVKKYNFFEHSIYEKKYKFTKLEIKKESSHERILVKNNQYVTKTVKCDKCYQNTQFFKSSKYNKKDYLCI